MNRLFLYPDGTGNDFLRDVSAETPTGPVDITPYIHDLPIVTVKGRTYRFIDNVGFGIDGYCTQVGDELHAAGKTDINYTSIAIKGLLGGFHPLTAQVTVDGVTKTYRNCWLAPTMKGRFYGGGMMPAPAQDRNAQDRSVSVMTFCGRSRLHTLMVFPSIFKGEHVKHQKMVEIRKGHRVQVIFDRPCPLQIDGETIKDVTEYTVEAK